MKNIISVENFSKAYWPKIVDLESATQATKLGAWAAAYGALASLVMLFFEIASFTAEELVVGALMWGAISWGIFKKSRFAAVAGLIIYLCDRAYALSIPDSRTLNIINIFMIVWLINGVRGAYQYRHFKKLTESGSATS